MGHLPQDTKLNMFIRKCIFRYHNIFIEHSWLLNEDFFKNSKNIILYNGIFFSTVDSFNFLCTYLI